MAPSNPIELLEQMSAEYALLQEEFHQVIEGNRDNFIEFRERENDAWGKIMDYVYEVRKTRQAEADAFMRDRHGMTWEIEDDWSGYSC